MKSQIYDAQPDGEKKGVVQQLVSSAKGAGSDAVDRFHSEVDNRKGAAVTQAQSVKSAIDRTADGLDDDAPEWLRSTLTQGAQQLQKFADAIDGKDSRQLASDLTDFARRKPFVFLVGCAVAGFAAARILSAGSAANKPTQPEPVGLDSAQPGMNNGSANVMSPSAGTATSIPATPVSGEFV